MAQRRQKRGAGVRQTVRGGVKTARTRAGQARKRARATTSGAARRGGRRPGAGRAGGRTKDQLYNDAKRLGISGRSKMNKAQLQRAVSRKRGS